MKKIIYFLLIISSISVFAQKKIAKPVVKDTVKIAQPGKYDKKLLHAANRLMNFKSYYNAIEKYKEFNNNFPDHEDATFKLSKALYITRDYKGAVNKFEEYLNNSKIKKRPEAYYYYGQSLKSDGQYDKAYKAFLDYTKLKDKSKDAKTLIAFANNEISAYTWIKKSLKEDSSDIHFTRLLGNMNRAYSDFSPFPIHHDTVVFASLAADSIVKYSHYDNEVSTIKLYETVRKDSVSWSAPIELEEYNNPYAHTANGVLSPDGKYFYFTRCLPDNNNDIQCNIYFVEYDTDKLKQHKPREVSGVNLNGFSSTQPTFQLTTKKGKGGKIDSLVTIYFSSNRPKGKGFDIWYAPMDKPGKFKDPKNCGNVINTIGDEVTPFFDNESNKFYFSSNYHWGFGGKDIFKTEGSQNKWTKPQNMMHPTNSSCDDTYYIPALNKDFKADAGYLVSNRPGGMALHSETCCDDIYYYKDKISEYITYSGQVVSESNEVLPCKTGDSLRLAYNSQLNKWKNIDTNLTAKNFQKYMKRKMSVADSSILNTVAKKKELLKSDTSAFICKDTPKNFTLMPNTQIGVIKRSDYNQLLATGDTSFASLRENIKWEDTSDAKANFNLKVKKNKDYIYVFHNPEAKTKIRKINFKSDSAEKIILEKVIVKKDSTPTLNNNLSSKIDKIDVEKNKETVLVLDNLYFDFDSDIIKEESRPVLNLLLNFLTKKPNVNMEIMGHTDSRGSDEHNMDLSQRRAEAVMSWLISQGIDEKRLTAIGYGETKPVLPNENPDGSDNPENRAKNRRTEVKILASSK